MQVPEVLLSGDHAEIERWRREAALREDPPQPARPRAVESRPAIRDGALVRAPRPAGTIGAPLP